MTARDAVDHVTGHWNGTAAFALLAGGVGALLRDPGVLFVGMLGAAFAGYARVAGPAFLPDGTADPPLAVERDLDPASPAPDEAVTVTVRVRNTGDRLLPDVRLVDGVPAELVVVEGSPRHGAVLPPGGTTTFSYRVAARRGDHRWDPVRVALADPSGTCERETSVAGDTRLRCPVPTTTDVSVPLRPQTSRRAGGADADAGGAGVAFHSTREYRPGDPLNRVDWYRRARHGDLGTLEFREERAADVMLVVDARKAAYVAPGPREPSAVERSVTGAGAAFASLLDRGDRAGITALGKRGDGCWLAPGAGADHRARGRELLTAHEAFSPVPPVSRMYDAYLPERRETLLRRRADALRDRLSPGTQVCLFSPCVDDYAETVATRLETGRHRVTVVSPDPTTVHSPARELAAMERTDRLRRLREAGVRVVDWQPSDDVGAAFERARRRWSR